MPGTSPVFLLLLLLVLPLAKGQDETQAVRSGASLSSSNLSTPGFSFKGTLWRVESDEKRIWSFAVRKAAIPAAGVIAVTAGLIVLDPIDSGYFRRTQSFSEFNRVFSGNITGYGTLAVPVALLTAGFLKDDPKMKATAVEAGEAMGNAELLAVVMKDITRREPPLASASGWFKDSSSSFLGSGSMPSGHATAAFAVATVISRRYASRRWVPWVAYGMAAAVGFSRVTESAHFLSDAFLGGAIGYSIGRLAVSPR